MHNMAPRSHQNVNHVLRTHHAWHAYASGATHDKAPCMGSRPYMMSMRARIMHGMLTLQVQRDMAPGVGIDVVSQKQSA